MVVNILASSTNNNGSKKKKKRSHTALTRIGSSSRMLDNMVLMRDVLVALRRNELIVFL